MSRKRKLTDAQEREILRRYYLYCDNMPWRIAEDFGVSKNVFNDAVKRQRRRERQA